jgi:outer membrane PBP1 activator LpoA protein
MSWTRYFAYALCCYTSSVMATETSVLLPLGGSTEKAAENIRNGLLAGYYHALSTNSSNDAPLLRFYDTTSINQIDSFVQKISANSQQIIGPLLKEHVAAVLANPPSVPVLALNRINNNEYASIWQFALAPEEELEPLIQLIQQEKIQKIKIIGASDNNSKRLQTGFEQAWLAKNGVLLASYTLSVQNKEASNKASKLY